MGRWYSYPEALGPASSTLWPPWGSHNKVYLREEEGA